MRNIERVPHRRGDLSGDGAFTARGLRHIQRAPTPGARLADGCYARSRRRRRRRLGALGFEFVNEGRRPLPRLHRVRRPRARGRHRRLCPPDRESRRHPVADPDGLPRLRADATTAGGGRPRRRRRSRRRRSRRHPGRRPRRRSRRHRRRRRYRRDAIADDAADDGAADDGAADDDTDAGAYPVPTVAGCTNGVLDTAHGEADVDCGGAYCPACGIGAACAVAGDCGSGCVSERRARRADRAPDVGADDAVADAAAAAPTRTPVVQVSLGLSGIDCGDRPDRLRQACARSSRTRPSRTRRARCTQRRGVTLTNEVRVPLALSQACTWAATASTPCTHT